MPTRGQKKLRVKIEKKKKTNKTNRTVVLEKRTNEDMEKEKLMLMRVGVACFMVIFFVAWIFNLKYQFKISSNNNSKSSFNWEQTKTDLNKALEQVKSGIEEIKQTQTAAQNATLGESKLTNEQINLLKAKLISEVASSTVATSTTATSTKNNK